MLMYFFSTKSSNPRDVAAGPSTCAQSHARRRRGKPRDTIRGVQLGCILTALPTAVPYTLTQNLPDPVGASYREVTLVFLGKDSIS